MLNSEEKETPKIIAEYVVELIKLLEEVRRYDREVKEARSKLYSRYDTLRAVDVELARELQLRHPSNAYHLRDTNLDGSKKEVCTACSALAKFEKIKGE